MIKPTYDMSRSIAGKFRVYTRTPSGCIAKTDPPISYKKAAELLNQLKAFENPDLDRLVLSANATEKEIAENFKRIFDITG